MRSRLESDTGTLELPKHKDRRRSSAPTLERQTSCKEIFQFLVEDCKDIDVCVCAWVYVYAGREEREREIV